MVMKKKIFIIVMTNNMPGISAWQKHCCEKKNREKTERNLKNIMTMTKKGYKKKKQDQ